MRNERVWSLGVRGWERRELERDLAMDACMHGGSEGRKWKEEWVGLAVGLGWGVDMDEGAGWMRWDE